MGWFKNLVVASEENKINQTVEIYDRVSRQTEKLTIDTDNNDDAVLILNTALQLAQDIVKLSKQEDQIIINTRSLNFISRIEFNTKLKKFISTK